jgi:hypothetical protein
MNRAPDPLDSLLADWKIQAEAPADFNRHVWQKIAADSVALPWSTRLISWWFTPRRLVASAAAAIIIGAALGSLDLQIKQHQAKAAYFSAINPLDSAHHHTLANR